MGKFTSISIEDYFSDRKGALFGVYNKGYITEQHYDKELAEIEAAEVETIRKANQHSEFFEPDPESSELDETADASADLRSESDFDIPMTADPTVPPVPDQTAKLLLKFAICLAPAVYEEAFAGDLEERYRADSEKFGTRRAKRNLFTNNLFSAAFRIREWCRNKITKLFKFTVS